MRASNTAMNPAVLEAFALAIIADAGRSSIPGHAGSEQDLKSARERAGAVRAAMDQLLKVAANAGSYVSKTIHDPEGLFFVHHGVGSEDWSTDGFTRLTGR